MWLYRGTVTLSGVLAAWAGLAFAVGSAILGGVLLALSCLCGCWVEYLRRSRR